MDFIHCLITHNTTCLTEVFLHTNTTIVSPPGFPVTGVHFYFRPAHLCLHPVINYQLTSSEAAQDCDKKGERLAVLDTDEKLSALKTIMMNNQGGYT